MFDKLKSVEERYELINEKLADPDVVNDQEQLKKLMQEVKQLTPIVEKFREYCTVKKNGEEAKQMLDEGGLDKELKELAEEEYQQEVEDTSSMYDMGASSWTGY